VQSPTIRGGVDEHHPAHPVPHSNGSPIHGIDYHSGLTGNVFSANGASGLRIGEPLSDNNGIHSPTIHGGVVPNQIALASSHDHEAA
jgi:hypothetical protein